MNAYKIADYVDAREMNNPHLKEAATMLRQQADRIAELEKLLANQVGADCREMRYIQEIENKNVRIAELERDLKKYDQLAWNDLSNPKTIWCDCGDGITADSGAKCGVCASTPQTKPLSDEEILDLWVKKNNLNGASDIIEFAREIRGEK